MKRAVPAIAVSAAGLTWLLHAQGVIDTKAAGRSTASAPTTTPPTGAAPPSPTIGPTSSNRTVDGPVVDTRYGPVQVEVVIGGGRISDVKAIEYPTDARRSQFISEQALPLLHDEALSVQSAHIDTISGATYTSDAYAKSLQAALDSAGLTRQ